MSRILVYGRGKYYNDNKEILTNKEVVGYMVSYDYMKHGMTDSVITPEEIGRIGQFDELWICTDYCNIGNIVQRLKSIDVPSSKIRFLVNECQDEYKVQLDENMSLIMSNNRGVRIRQVDGSDFAVVDEVFIRNCYNIVLEESEYVVVDAGMNIGAASLFFAQNPHVSRVYSFEPFRDTYERALENFKLSDKSVSDKIIPENCGLSDMDGNESVLLSNDQVADRGGRSIINDAVEEKTNGRRIEIEKISASTVIRNIISDNPDKKIILKCDIEGSEHVIFEKWNEDGLLKNFSWIVMEVHFPGVKRIREMLSNAGFDMYISGNLENQCLLIGRKR